MTIDKPSAVLHILPFKRNNPPSDSCECSPDSDQHELCDCIRDARMALRFASVWTNGSAACSTDPQQPLLASAQFVHAHFDGRNKSLPGVHIDLTELIHAHLSSIDAQTWPDGTAVFPVPGMTLAPRLLSLDLGRSQATGPNLSGITYEPDSLCPDAITTIDIFKHTCDMNRKKQSFSKTISISSHIARALASSIKQHLDMHVAIAVAPSPLLARLACLAHVGSFNNIAQMLHICNTPIVIVIPSNKTKLAHQLLDNASARLVLASEPSDVTSTLFAKLAQDPATKTPGSQSSACQDESRTENNPQPITVSQIRSRTSQHELCQWLGNDIGNRCWNRLSGIDHDPIISTGPLEHITVRNVIQLKSMSECLKSLTFRLMDSLAREKSTNSDPSQVQDGSEPPRSWNRYASVLEITIQSAQNNVIKATKSILTPNDIYNKPITPHYASIFYEKTICPIVDFLLQSNSQFTTENSNSSYATESRIVVTLSLSGFSPYPPRPSIEAFFKGLIDVGSDRKNASNNQTHAPVDSMSSQEIESILAASSIDMTVYSALPKPIQQQIIDHHRAKQPTQSPSSLKKPTNTKRRHPSPTLPPATALKPQHSEPTPSSKSTPTVFKRKSSKFTTPTQSTTLDRFFGQKS